MWDELAPVYHRVGCLKETHVEAFAHMCKQYAIARRKSDGDGLRALAQADRIMARFGGTPSDMAKVVVEKVEDDPFSKFLGKAK